MTEEAKQKGGVTEKDAEYMVEGWLEESSKGDVIESFVDNDGKGWTGW